MSSAQVYEIMVEYAEPTSPRHCSQSPSTSSSSNSASNSGASSPASSTTSSTSSSRNPRVRRFSKTKKTAWNSIRRSSRKILTAGKKYARKLTSSSSSKMRYVKYKIDKHHQRQMAESKARVERFKREREELIAGNSQVAILCEDVTTNARSLRETYERQRPVVYHAVLQALFGREEEEVFDDEEVEEGFIGAYFY